MNLEKVLHLLKEKNHFGKWKIIPTCKELDTYQLCSGKPKQEEQTVRETKKSLLKIIIPRTLEGKNYQMKKFLLKKRDSFTIYAECLNGA